MISEEKEGVGGIDNYNVTNQRYQAQEIPRGYRPVGKHTAKMFGWMFLGPMMTLPVSMAGYMTGATIYAFMIPYAIFVLAVAGVAVVLSLSARINKVPAGATKGLSFLYTMLDDIVFSVYLLMYNVSDMVIVFAATSVFSDMMVTIGYATKVDLSEPRNFLAGGLIFLVAFWLFGMFTSLAQFKVVTCTVGVFIFLLFTAYDIQKIKVYHAAYGSNPGMMGKASIFSALQLYLDFINPFLYLLRILGRKK